MFVSASVKPGGKGTAIWRTKPSGLQEPEVEPATQRGLLYSEDPGLAMD
jgi:hypothetical protein